MFLFIVIIIFFVLMGLLIGYSVKNKRIKNRYLGEDALFNAALNIFKKKKKTKIHCEYCGNLIDTKKHDTCPSCGAPYDKNKEWLESNFNNAKDSYEYEIANRKDVVNTLNQVRVNKIRKIILIIAIIVCGFIGLFILSNNITKQDYLSNDIINETVYKPVEEYEIKDKTLIDNEYFTVEFGKIYKSYSSYKIEVFIENKTDKNCRLTFDNCAVNNTSEHSGYILNDKVGAKTRVSRLFTCNLYTGLDIESEELVNMYFTNFHFYDEEKYTTLYKDEGIYKVETTSDYKLVNYDEKDLVYKKNDIVLYVTYTSLKDPLLVIENNSEEDYYFEIRDMEVNGYNDKFFWMRGTLPSGCRDNDNLKYSFQNIKGKADISLRLDCKCLSDKTKTFTSDVIYFNIVIGGN